MNRKDFADQLTLISLGTCMPSLGEGFYHSDGSNLPKLLTPVGRALEREAYCVWRISPTEAEDVQIHVSFSHWISKNHRPAYPVGTSRGGKYMGSSPFILKIN